MSRRPIESVRNIGIIAHIDAGKTTTTERFLFYSGKSHRLGEVHDGQAIMDFREDEKERGITISSAATTFAWRDHEINLIDTPGHVDFVAEVERSLRVLDGAVVIFDAAEGVEPQSESVWHQADRYAVPRICFLNKMDKVGADFEASLDSIRRRLGATPAPVTLPHGASESLAGILDVIERRLLVWDAASQGARFEARDLPPEAREPAEAARARLVEMVADHSDPIAEAYLAGESIDAARLRAALRQATLAGKLFPVLAGSSLRNLGVQPLLDAVCHYLPSPSDRPPAQGVLPGTGEPKRRYPRDTDPTSAFVFKVTAHAAADLYYTRVYSGRVRAGDALWNPRTGRKERIRRLFRMHADRSTPEEEAAAGEIVALSGLKDCATGDTLCDPAHPIEYEPIRFPATVVSVAVEPRNAEERERLEEVLARLEREDPTFHRRADEETGQTILSGMGELHLEVLRHRMEREFQVRAHFGKPRVSYRETVLEPVEATGTFDRAVGGASLRAEVVLELRPEPAVHGVRVSHEIPDGALPAPIVAGLIEAVRGSAEGGGAYGFPVTRVHATVRAARVLEGSDLAAALQPAAALALMSALGRARVAVLEPIMRFEVRAPEEHLGAVLRHLNARRAAISATTVGRAQSAIAGTVPLAEMFGFSTTLRSLTQGRASFSMEPHDYQPVPDAAAFPRRLAG
jgi:elongation factor G